VVDSFGHRLQQCIANRDAHSIDIIFKT
jgi:hypothetical protein